MNDINEFPILDHLEPAPIEYTPEVIETTITDKITEAISQAPAPDLFSVLSNSPYETLFIVIAIIVGMYFLHPFIAHIISPIIKIETLASTQRSTDHDTRLRDMVSKEVAIIDYDARRRMREAARKVAARTLVRYPDCEEVILRGRIALSTAICDNHITYDLKRDAEGYMLKKVEESENETYRRTTPREREAIVWKVVHWTWDVIHIQKRAIEEKLRIYWEVAKEYKLQRFKEVIEARIEKNEQYLIAIATLAEQLAEARSGMISAVSSKLDKHESITIDIGKLTNLICKCGVSACKCENDPEQDPNSSKSSS